jgi:uncharacterized protein (DUF433 family)
MKLPDFLTENAYGDIRLTGSRIGLYHVIREYQNGATAELIATEFPTVPLAQVYKVIGFYLENRPEVDEYVRQVEEELERQSAAGRHLDVAKLQARMAEIRREQSRTRA